MLVPMLIALDRHDVTVFDIGWFGSGHLPDNPRVRLIRGDVRDIRGMRDACVGQDAVLWLASLSNNAMCERYPVLHDRVNKDAVPAGLYAARIAGVKRFIYASSVAAYGSSERDAVETDPLAPSTPYADAKRYAEEWTKMYNADDFTTCITRSASVCGYSVHQRFDLTVNKMVHDAVRYGAIKVNGGQQKRCHIHIRDICDAYRILLAAPDEDIAGQAFNFVAENATVLETANIVAEETGAKIEIGPATDDRSYTVDGRKAALELGFRPLYTVRQAVRDLVVWFEEHARGNCWPDLESNPDRYFNMAEGLR